MALFLAYMKCGRICIRPYNDFFAPLIKHSEATKKFFAQLFFKKVA